MRVGPLGDPFLLWFGAAGFFTRDALAQISHCTVATLVSRFSEPNVPPSNYLIHNQQVVVPPTAPRQRFARISV
jgi:hypothetical protein